MADKRSAKTKSNINFKAKSGDTITLKTDGNITSISPSMDETVTNYRKFHPNPTLNEFEAMVKVILNDVKAVVAYRELIKDNSSTSISHYTNDAIKKVLRASRWA